ncbi:MAG: tripartite tricarboxylate transporter TctB family protein [Clostridia bacterium]
MLERNKNLIGALLFLVFGILGYVSTFSFPQSVAKIGPDFVPKIVFGLTIILSIMLIVGHYSSRKKIASSQDKNAEEARREVKFKPNIILLIVVVLLFAYVLLLESIGFMILTPILLFALITLLSPEGENKYLRTAVISLVTTFAVYYVFRVFFNVMISNGILG